MKRFYLKANLEPDEIITAPPEIIRHMHALRVSIDEVVEFFDGDNGSYKAEVLNLERRNATLKIIQKNSLAPISSSTLSLAIAVVANDKMDLIIGKAVELGVNHIIPIYSEYSARLVNERIANKLIHWQNIIISSCEQCGQNQLPIIDPPIPLDSLYKNLEYDLKIVMNVPEHSTNRNNLLGIQNKFIKKTVLLVGPEGGFTESEVRDAAKYDYQSLRLGNLIMRSETAAIAGLSVLNLYLNQYGKL